jgi:hypothetical protein
MATKNLKKVLTSGSHLINVSNNRTLQHEYELIVTINGIRYRVVRDEISSRPHILIEDIPTHFKTGFPSVVKLTNFRGDEMLCLICFYHIPSPSDVFSCLRFPPIHFSIYAFKHEDFIDVRFALNSDENSPNFALGCFNVYSFIQEFRRATLLKYHIPVLWKMLIDALCKIGYFDIYDYHDFQTTVFVLFQRMIIFPENFRDLRELFYSFVQRLLAMNSWFLIVDKFIQPVRRPSQGLIRLFSDLKNPPIVNFINPVSGVVGLTKSEGVGIDFRFIFALVSLRTTEVSVVDSSNESECCLNASKELDDIAGLFASDDNDYDCPPLRRTPASINTSAITQGFSRFGPLELIIFKIGNSINVFIKRSDGTFDNFNFYFFILSKMFAVGDEFDQFKNHLTYFSYILIKDLVKGLLECGFLPIFDGTATTEQIRVFLIKSDFGCVLQGLRHEIEGFSERLHKQCLIKYNEEVKKGEVENPTPVKVLLEAHLDSIRENDFIRDFKRIFEFLLEKLGNRDDLTPEIQEILHFLGQLVEFLNPV